MLTNKGKYGLKAMLHLAGSPPDTLVSVQDIADSNQISKKFLDAIMAELRNAGLVYSRKGKGGGYRLARAADEIRVGQIIRVLDGPLAPIACASRAGYQPCEDCDEARCAVRLMMIKVRDAMASVLDHYSLDDMRALSPEERDKALIYYI